MAGELERTSKDEVEKSDRVSMEEIANEEAVPLPAKEVLSLLDINANVDLGLDLAAPVDLAAAANLNVAAPIEAAVSANVLSDGGQAVGLAHQSGSIDQGISGSANADAPQHAGVDQNANPAESGSATGQAADGAVAPTAGGSADGVQGAVDGAAGAAGGAVDGAAGAAGGAVDGAAGAAGGAVDGATHGAVDGANGGATGAQVGDAAGGAVDGAAGAAGGAVGDAGGTAGDVSGGSDSLVNGGSLLDANVNIHANADAAAPVDGAVAANGNVAAPIDASAAANVGSDNAIAESVAQQEVNVNQHLDDVDANATAAQDASIDQQ